MVRLDVGLYVTEHDYTRETVMKRFSASFPGVETKIENEFDTEKRYCTCSLSLNIQ